MTAVTMPTRAVLRLAEIFGPTLQGEGMSCGQRAVFVRLSGCNLDCDWCDTPYTWDWRRFDREQHLKVMPVEAVVSWVLDRDADLVVISGGEPLLQRRRLLPLVSALRAAGRRIEIETNGTVDPGPELAARVRFNVSPKLGGSGVSADRRIKPAVLTGLRDSGNAIFKFVISDSADLAELIQLQQQLDLAPVWVMPEGIKADEIITGLRELAKPALAHGWHLTPRLQVLLWGDERGR